MYNSYFENNLISPDIVNLMQDHCSIQMDIDETKVKAAAKIAQDIDLKRVIKKVNLDRCITPDGEADDELRELVIPAWCFFTFSRCLKLFQGSFTDSGYVISGEAEDRNAAKSAANEAFAVGEAYLNEVLEFLKSESNDPSISEENMTPNIRVFGGEENRASN